MGTNSTGCTEWERDYDPVTEQPRVKPMPDIVEAPWTDEQVANLTRWQNCGYVHEFTCPNHHEASRALVATRDGWHCPGCGYTQTWAHAMMTLGPPPLELGR